MKLRTLGKQVTCIVDYSDWNKYCQTVLPELTGNDTWKKYEVIAWEEWGNDSQHVVNVTERDVKDFGDYELGNVEDCDMYNLHDTFTYLVSKGLLEYGNYTIQVCW